MSLKLGKIRTETRSWLPKWPIIGHYFSNLRNIWKTRPDIKQNMQFQIGIYHRKIQLDLIQNGRPVATFDFNMRYNWKNRAR